MKKYLTYFVITATLISLFVPVASLRAQTCNPDTLTQVRYGQRSAAVRNLQACLMELGYNIPAGATGYYGSQTRTAVKNFYRDYLNMSWHGNWVGPQGIETLKSALAQAPAPEEEAQAPQAPSGISADVLAQVLQKIQAGDLQGALALLLGALGAQVPTTPSGEQPQPQPQPQPTTEGLTPGVPGFLYAEVDPSVTGVTVREGETAKVFGIKFRAESGAVRVDSVVLRWSSSNPAAPHRILSKLEVLDESGNVLASKSASDFLVDSNLNYYLPVTGLNLVVPANQYKSIFVNVTLVGTLPSVSGVWPQDIVFTVSGSDIRGVDGTGAVISASAAPSTLTLQFSADVTVAGTAYFVTAINPSSPQEGYVFAQDLVNGKAQNVPALVVNLTAKNDNLRITEMKGSVSNTSTVERVRVSIGNVSVVQTPASDGSWTVNLTPYGIVVNKDQTQTVTIAVDLRGATNTPATFTVSVSTTTAQNSLGDTKAYATQATSQVLGYVKGGPTFVVNSKQLVLKAKKDSNQNITTTTVDSVTYSVKVMANGIDVYIPTSSPVYVEIVKPDNSIAATTTLNVVNVNPVNTELVNRRYRIPAGNEVTFEFTAIPNKDLSGNLTLRAWVKSISWGYDSSSTPNTATFMANDPATWATSFVTPQ
ncbi:MAG: peptidoglycan-binding domain-containing protein [Thermoplasmata archaeon]